MPTISDVARGYRLFLGREIESTAVAGHQIAASPSLWAMVEGFYGCAEAVRRRTGEAALAIGTLDDRQGVKPDATPEQLTWMVEQVEADWARRGLGSYHQWLLRDVPRYDARSVKWNLARLFEAGRQEAASLLGLCAGTGVSLDDVAAVVVLGADAFRMAGALASGGGRYIGIDVSPEALAVGQAGLADHGLLEAELISVGAFRRHDLGYDLFYSVLCLQYAPPPMALALLSRGLAQVNPGGLAYVQLAGHLHDYSFDAAAYVACETRDPHGEIHAVPQHHVLRVFEQHGFAMVEVKPDGRLGSLGVSYTYFARRRA